MTTEKSLVLAQESAIAIIDGIVTSVDASVNGGAPLLSVAWGLSKGLYYANIQLRQSRAVEFVEMIRDKPGIFTKELLQTEEFQDGFVYCFQKYICERLEEKRQIIKGIFIGFSEAENKRDFKLERLLHTLEQLSPEDIEVVKTFSDGTINQWTQSQFPDMEALKIEEKSKQALKIEQIGKFILRDLKGMQNFNENDYTIQTLSRLSSLGLVLGGITASYDYSQSNYRESSFGRDFISYVLS